MADKIHLVRSMLNKKSLKYRVVACCDTPDPLQENSYKVILDDNGEWSIECDGCGEAVTLSELIELGNART